MGQEDRRALAELTPQVHRELDALARAYLRRRRLEYEIAGNVFAFSDLGLSLDRQIVSVRWVVGEVPFVATA